MGGCRQHERPRKPQNMPPGHEKGGCFRAAKKTEPLWMKITARAKAEGEAPGQAAAADMEQKRRPGGGAAREKTHEAGGRPGPDAQPPRAVAEANDRGSTVVPERRTTKLVPRASGPLAIWFGRRSKADVTQR